MTRTLFYLVIILFPFICKGESNIDNYYQRMIKDIRPLFQGKDTIPLNSIKGYKGDWKTFVDKNYKNLHNLSNAKNQYFFIYLSKSLMGIKDQRVNIPDSRYPVGFREEKILTAQEFDKIEKWWNENAIYLTTDFLEDAFFSRNVLPYIARTKSIKKRLDYRRKMLKENGSDSCQMEMYAFLEKNRELKDGLISLQKTFNQFFEYLNDEYIIETVVPTFIGQVFIYKMKAIMFGETYEPNTPVTREEFDEIKDWLFLNAKSVRNSQFPTHSFTVGLLILDKEYYDDELPDESY